MSGHSKWSTIKHKKALIDAKRGKAFSRLSALISIIAKHGNDPTMNPNLRLYIEKAKQVGMTKENIERAIKRGTGEFDGASLEEVTYEAYAPGGVGIIIEAITDNKNRAIAEIKSVLNKFGGKLAEHGSVNYQFKKQGVINVKKGKISNDEISLTAIDAGAKDIDESDDSIVIYTEPSNFEAIKKAIEELGVTIESAEISLEPKQTIAVEESKKESVIKLLEALDDLDDVTNISANADI